MSAAVRGIGKQGSASALRAVTADDSNDLPGGAAYISVATAGVYRVIALADSSSVDVYYAAGIVQPDLIKRVFSTGSAATTGIVAHYV